MLLSNYDFYDLYAFITYFRSRPERFPDYIPSAQQMAAYLTAPAGNQIEDNVIRKMISPFYSAQDEALSWVSVNNRYTAHLFIVKKQAYYEILSSLLEEMTEACNDGQRMILLCDASHNIPLLLADEKKPKPIINRMVKDYRNKYNQLFLTNELNSL